MAGFNSTYVIIIWFDDHIPLLCLIILSYITLIHHCLSAQCCCVCFKIRVKYNNRNIFSLIVVDTTRYAPVIWDPSLTHPGYGGGKACVSLGGKGHSPRGIHIWCVSSRTFTPLGNLNIWHPAKTAASYRAAFKKPGPRCETAVFAGYHVVFV